MPKALYVISEQNRETEPRGVKKLLPHQLLVAGLGLHCRATDTRRGSSHETPARGTGEAAVDGHPISGTETRGCSTQAGAAGGLGSVSKPAACCDTAICYDLCVPQLRPAVAATLYYGQVKQL